MGRRDDLPETKNTFRQYAQNINGLKIDEKGGDLNQISEFLNIYQCDIVGLSEINLDVTKYKVQRILAETLTRSFEANQSCMSTSEIPFDNMYKPGGTMTTILNNAVCMYQWADGVPSRCRGNVGGSFIL